MTDFKKSFFKGMDDGNLKYKSDGMDKNVFRVNVDVISMAAEQKNNYKTKSQLSGSRD